MPAPTLTGFAPSITLDENTVNATPQLLDADVSFSDVDGDFDGGFLTLSGLLAEDRVSVRNQGTGAGQIGLSGSNVTFGGVVIGSLAGGVGGTLTITFNASATSAAIEALIENLTYANVSNTPTASRTLRLNVTDAAGESMGGVPTFTPAVGAADPFQGSDLGEQVTPALVDLDGDGDLDLVVGGQYGDLRSFRNDSGAFTELFGNDNPFDGFRVGNSYGSYSAPTFVDLDGDGDLDLVTGERYGRLEVWRNGTIGTSGAFTPLTGGDNPFDGVDVGYLSKPAFADLDGDGDLDLVVSNAYGELSTFRRDGDAFTQLSGLANPLHAVSGSNKAAPTFVDLDGDGDQDLVLGQPDGTLRVFGNANGVFTELAGPNNPFDGLSFGTYVAPTFGDLDGDGDLDLIVANQYGILSTVFNTTAPAPGITVTVTAQNDAPSSVGLPTDFTVTEDVSTLLNDQLSAFTITDLDTSGNITLTLTAGAGILNVVDGGGYAAISGSGTGTVVLTGTAANLGAILRDGSLSVSYTGSANLSGNDATTITFTADDGSGPVTLGTVNVDITAVNDPVELTGLATSVTFGENTANASPQLLDVDVTLTDVDNDFTGGALTLSGLLAEDRVSVRNEGSGAGQIGLSGTDVTFGGVTIGALTGGVGSTLRITFNAAATSTAVDALIQNLTYANISNTPTATRDLVLGVTDAGGANLGAAPAFELQAGGANPLQGLDVGSASSPTLVDLDGDGDQDLVVGEFGGSIRVYRNGTDGAAGTFAERTGADNPFDGIDVGVEASPAFVDLDGDGDLDLVVGHRDGGLRVWRNGTDGAAGVFTERTGANNPFSGIDVGDVSSPTFADLDGDGDQDLVVGADDGMFRTYRNGTIGSSGAFDTQSGTLNPINGIFAGTRASGSLFDIDSDGDLDLISGSQSGLLRVWRNNGANGAIGNLTELVGAANPFNGIDAGDRSEIAFGDLDGDGDIDAVLGGFNGLLSTLLNTATVGPTITVNVTAENDAPTATGLPTDVTVTEDVASNLNLSAITLAADVVGDITVVLTASAGTMTASSGAGVVVTNSGTGAITLTGTATAIDAFLNSASAVQYTGALNANGDNAATVTVTADDGSGSVTLGVVNVDITAVNDAMSLTGFATSVTFDENTVNATPQLLDIDVSFSDPDSFNGGALTLSGLLAEDRVSVRNEGSGAGQIGLSGTDVSYGGVIIGALAGGSGATLTITFNASATSTAIDALIQNLTYANVSHTPTASRSLVLNVTDAAGGDLSTGPSFTQRTGAANPFGDGDGDRNGPALADLDGDGDMDLLVGSDSGTFRYFENTGSATAASFTERTGAANPMNGFDIGAYSRPTFVDMDGDGDLDVFTGAYFGSIQYFENTGTAAAPVFTHQIFTGPLAGVSVGYQSSPTFADLDGDGDRDAVVGEADGTLNYFENTGTAAAAVFTQRTGAANPFDGLAANGGRSNPVLVDVDGDGDTDLVSGNVFGQLEYFENTGSAAAPVFVQRTGAANPFNGVDVGYVGAPAFADMDGDGDLDLVVGNDIGELGYIENTSSGPGQTITVTVTAQNDAPTATGLPTDVTVVEDVPSNLDLSAVVLGDLDTSGDITVVLTASAGVLTATSGGGVTVTDSGTGAITLTGTASAIDVFLNTAANIQYTGTLNANGDNAATVTVSADDGSGSVTLGTVNVDITAVNDAMSLTGFGPSATFDENTVNAAPQVLDIDVAFTDPDSFTGGALTITGVSADDRYSVRNEGTGAGQIGLSGTDVTYGGVVIGTLAGGVGASLTITFNAAANGVAIDALIQNLTYANVSDTPNANTSFTLNITDASGDGLVGTLSFGQTINAINPLRDVDIGSRSSPTFVDYDGDGDVDAVVGTLDGELAYYENTGTAAAPVFTQRLNEDNPFGFVLVGSDSAPTFADLDNDGDQDLVIGRLSSSLTYFENTGTASVPVFTQRTGAANPFNGLNVGSDNTPALGDLDGDGDLDVVVGRYAGGLQYLENTGTAAAPAFVLRTGAANPFSGISTGYYSAPSLVDADGDGDLDVVVTSNDGVIRYFENTGGASAPAFTEHTGAANPFNGIATGVGAVAFTDLDGDGDIDAAIGDLNGQVRYLRNNTQNGQTFNIVINSQNDAPTQTGLPTDVTVTEDVASNLNLSAVTLADADNAGSISVTLTASAGTMTAVDGGGVTVSGSGTGTLVLTGTISAIDTYLNTASAVQYTGALNANGDNAATVTVSADDGSGSVTLGVVNVDITAVNDPMSLTGFAASVTFGENTVNATPQLLDADVTFVGGDSDFNGGSLTLSGLLAEDRVSVRNVGTASGEIGLSGADVTFGGVVIGTLAGGAGGTMTITFNAAATAEAIDALIENLTYANVSDTPTAARNLVLNVTDAAGNALGTPPAFVARTGGDNPFNGIDVGVVSTPALVDLDGDGDMDAVFGEFNGAVLYFENTGTASAPVFTARTGAANPFDGLDVGARSAISLADLDGDGDMDALVGEEDGFLNYLENTGTAAAPVFTQRTGAANPFDGFDVGVMSTPALVDLDGDGDLDAVVGEDNGALLYFENTGTTAAAAFTQRTGGANPFNDVDVGFQSAVAFTDVDGDGDLDAVVGENDGTLRFFENTGTGLAPAFSQRSGAANPFNGVDVGNFSNLTFGDVDSDGDMDAVVGEQPGTLRYFENTTVLSPRITVHVTPEADTFTGTGADETLTGATAGDVVNGLGGDDLLIGGAGAQTLNGGEGGDTLRGAGGDDLLAGGNGSDTADYSTATAGVSVRLAVGVTLSDGDGGVDTLSSIENATGSAYADLLFGSAGDNVLNGGLGADTLLGLDGNDILIGGGGAANTLQGGLGDDIYVVSANDTVTEFSGQGVDTVRTDRAVYVLGAHIENLSYTGAAMFVGTGNGLANVITGAAARDVLTGDAGDDTLVGRGGQDTLFGGLGLDTADYSAAAAGISVRLAVNVTLDDGDGSTDTLSGIENVTGSAFNDQIFGDAGGNVLSGGLGADTLLGLDGADTLIGGAGAANTLQGGLGDDVYVVTANDTITELSGQGTDTVQTDRAFFTLGANLENLTYIGSGAFQGTGNALDNVITGGLGSDTLIGGQGNDTLVGGGGVDYVVLSGALADYTVTDLGGGSYEIADAVGGRDGTDIVSGVERVRFATGPTVAIASLAVSPTPSQPVDKQASDPQILPGLTDDDFLMAKDGDAPLVLPGADGIDEGSLEIAPLLPLRPGHMLTVGDGGAPVEGPEVFGGRHDHDGWLF